MLKGALLALAAAVLHAPTLVDGHGFLAVS